LQNAAAHIERKDSEKFEAVILSEQVTAAEVQALLEANPEFAVWYKQRAAERAKPRDWKG
jgi:hypothetical protein